MADGFFQKYFEVVDHLVAAIELDVPEYYFVVELLVADVCSHEVPLVQGDTSISCGLHQVDLVLIILELEDHRHVVEMALSVGPCEHARRRVGLEEEKVTCIGALEELGLGNLVELPRLFEGVRTLVVLVALAVFDVSAELLFPCLGLLCCFGPELEYPVLHTHYFDSKLERLVRMALDAVHEVVEVEHSLWCLHVLRAIALVVLEFAILQHEVAVLPPGEPGGTLLLEEPFFLLGQPHGVKLLLKFGGQNVVDGRQTQLGNLAAQVVRIKIVLLLQYHLLIFIFFDLSVPVEEYRFERGHLVLFLLELCISLEFITPLSVVWVVGGDEVLGICLTDGITLAHILVLLEEGLLLTKLHGIEVSVVLQVGIVLPLGSRSVIQSWKVLILLLFII